MNSKYEGNTPIPFVPEDEANEGINSIRDYWNVHIHDLEIAKNPIGSEGFFKDLEDYRFEKLDYLPRVANFSAYTGKRLLEVGCGVAIDLVRFAKGGAEVTGIDLSDVAIGLAKKNFDFNNVTGNLLAMNGEDMKFEDESFDVVYAHGVLQYTQNIQKMIREIHRVLRPGGEAVLMVYNRLSWLNLLSKVFSVKLEHEDAPCLNTYSISQIRSMLSGFSKVQIKPERFPVKTRLHHGLKATVYNTIFVGGFNMIPMPLVRPFGWHIMSKAIK